MDWEMDTEWEDAEERGLHVASTNGPWTKDRCGVEN